MKSFGALMLMFAALSTSNAFADDTTDGICPQMSRAVVAGKPSEIIFRPSALKGKGTTQEYVVVERVLGVVGKPSSSTTNTGTVLVQKFLVQDSNKVYFTEKGDGIVLPLASFNIANGKMARIQIELSSGGKRVATSEWVQGHWGKSDWVCPEVATAD